MGKRYCYRMLAKKDYGINTSLHVNENSTKLTTWETWAEQRKGHVEELFVAFPSEEWLAGAWNSLLMSEKAQKPKDTEKTGKTCVPLTPVVPGNVSEVPLRSAWEEGKYGILWLDFLVADISFASNLTIRKKKKRCKVTKAG